MKAVVLASCLPPPSGQLEVIMDRRLMQDDNRGLGQGLKDNKKTANRFRLLLERRSTGNKVSEIMWRALLKFPHITSDSVVLNDSVQGRGIKECFVLDSVFINTFLHP